jgi:hypothetical protein
MLLLLTTICLLACTRRAQNTVKSFLLILGAYVAAALAVAELAEHFTTNYPEEPVDIVVGISWVVLAFGFPVFVGWDLKDVFHSKKSKSTQSRVRAVASVPPSQPGDSKVLDDAQNLVDASPQRSTISENEARREQEHPPTNTRSVDDAANDRLPGAPSRNLSEN